jgi:hypothetical protein
MRPVQVQEVQPSSPPALAAPNSTVQEIKVQPVVIRLPERIIERERDTEPLQPINVTVAPPAAPQVTVIVPPVERSHDERAQSPRSDSWPETERTNFVPKTDTNNSPEEQKEFDPANEESSDEEHKTLPPENKNTVPNNSPNNAETIPEGELFEPAEPASEEGSHDLEMAFKKVGKVGRQRKYEELGIDDIEPVKEVVLFRSTMGQHWPGMSEDMQDYYEYWYFTRPNKRKDGKDHARHLKCWERKERWITPAETASSGDSSTVIAYRKRAGSSRDGRH